jgi:ABC-2 type transport system permease protein
MSFRRILAVLTQEFYITRMSLEVLVDLFFFSTITIVGFGFTSLFLTGKIAGVGGYYILLGLLLWEIIRINQYSVSMGALWNIWARNLSNLFVTPLTTLEYVSALMLSAILKSIFVFILLSTLAAIFFKFNIFNLGTVNLFLFFINLTIFSWSIGLFLLGFIFLFSTRIQALAWAFIFLFQPLSATFFPVEILPRALQIVAYLLPTTYVFEAARAALENPTVNWSLFGIGLFENLLYFGLTIIAFKKMLERSKQTGQFARNEG